MTDKELLELAAKAAGIRLEWIGDASFDCTKLKAGKPTCKGTLWTPLYDDGDALRLAVLLDLPFRRAFNNTFETGNDKSGRPIWEHLGSDPYAAARRAIVRAAAEIGKTVTP